MLELIKEFLNVSSIFVELEALGDEIGLDDDASYLDDAVSAPNAPTKEPGAESVTNKARLFTNVSHYQIASPLLCHHSSKLIKGICILNTLGWSLSGWIWITSNSSNLIKIELGCWILSFDEYFGVRRFVLNCDVSL